MNQNGDFDYEVRPTEVVTMTFTAIGMGKSLSP